jgi:hypothetical protein
MVGAIGGGGNWLVLSERVGSARAPGRSGTDLGKHPAFFGAEEWEHRLLRGVKDRRPADERGIPRRLRNPEWMSRQGAPLDGLPPSLIQEQKSAELSAATWHIKGNV